MAQQSCTEMSTLDSTADCFITCCFLICKTSSTYIPESLTAPPVSCAYNSSPIQSLNIDSVLVKPQNTSLDRSAPAFVVYSIQQKAGEELPWEQGYKNTG